jgi:hypothetical protein
MESKHKFTPIDIEIIFEILPKMWQTIILGNIFFE